MNKAQVVYYLSHKGCLEQPHLIEVEHDKNSLFLRDVKKRLMELRGRDMPDAFSWAYKRSYKNDFIWNDICDDDVIVPVVGQGFVLKGSENVYDNQAISKSGSKSRKNSNVLGASLDTFTSPFKSHVEQMRASETYENRQSPMSVNSPMSENRHSPISENRHSSASSKSPRDALRVNRRLMESLTHSKTYRSGECTADDMASNNAPSEESSITPNVKVYNTPASPVTADHGRDAATQTEEDDRNDDIRSQAANLQANQVQCNQVHSPVSLNRGQSEENFRNQAVALRQLLNFDTNSLNSRMHYPEENWEFDKSRSDGNMTIYSPKPRAPRGFHGNEDPEFMPEVVKETSDSAVLKQSIFRDENLDLLKSSMVLVLSPRKKERRCNDNRPLTPGRTRSDWEKTLHEAVKTNVPPADFGQNLQACAHCGRTFKPESLKVHMRGCRSQCARSTSANHVAKRA